MVVLSISSDRKVFEKRSAVRTRLLQYGSLVEELHVIIFAKKSLGFTEEKIAPNIYLYPTNSLSKTLYIFSAISIARGFKRKDVDFDLVTTQDPFEAGFVGYILARLFKARLHMQIHTDVMSPYFANESIQNRIRVYLAKFLLLRANAIRVVSERIKNSLLKINSKISKVSVLPILVEYTDEEKNLEIEKKFPQFSKLFLVASRLSREKNIGMAIEAMRFVVQKYPSTGLVVVGDGPQKDHLKKLVKRYSLESNVIFEGWQNNLTPYYKMADALVISSFYEGYGMVAVEALQAGCPVIMTDVGCAGEVVKDRQNGLVVPVGDLPALTRAMELVASRSVELVPKPPILPTQTEYISYYKKSWDDALA